MSNIFSAITVALICFAIAYLMGKDSYISFEKSETKIGKNEVVITKKDRPFYFFSILFFKAIISFILVILGFIQIGSIF